ARGIGAVQLGDPGDVLVRQVEPAILAHLLGRDRLPPAWPGMRRPVDPSREDRPPRTRLDGRAPGGAAQVPAAGEFVREPTTPRRAGTRVSPPAHASLSGATQLKTKIIPNGCGLRLAETHDITGRGVVG